MASQKLQFLTTDVFTSTRYEGNPLAIVRLPASQKLTQDQKQKIAAEFNLSETVILHESEESYRTSEWTFDIFITTRELPFAGHPTIGTIVYLGRSLQATGAGGIIKGTLKAKAGRLPFTYDTASATASAEIPHDSHLHKKTLDAQALGALGVAEVVTAGLVAPVPFVAIVKGMTFGLVELSSLEALGQVAPGYKGLDKDGLTPEYDCDGFVGLYFYHVTEQSDNVTKVRTRMVTEALEDPATGSASTALAAYLAIHHPSRARTDNQVHKLEVTQGVEMGRKSVIGVEVTASTDRKIEKVVLSGTAVEIMDGSIVAPLV